MGACQDINKPEVDESALICEEIIATDCIATTTADSYLKIGIGITLTSVITKISNTIKALRNNTIQLSNLQTFADDIAAATGGIAVGKAYIRVTGELAIRLT